MGCCIQHHVIRPKSFLQADLPLPPMDEHEESKHAEHQEKKAVESKILPIWTAFLNSYNVDVLCKVCVGWEQKII